MREHLPQAVLWSSDLPIGHVIITDSSSTPAPEEFRTISRKHSGELKPQRRQTHIIASYSDLFLRPVLR